MLNHGMLSVLAAGIENNKFLVKLTLQNNFIDDLGLSKLISGLRANTSISQLDLSQNRIKDKGIEQLCAFMKFNGSKLQRLIAAQNLIETDFFGEVLGRYLSAIVKKLTICILHHIRDQQLEHLDISYNSYSAESFESLFKGLSGNSRLESLDLRVKMLLVVVLTND